MKKRADQEYLLHILDAANLIQKYCQALDEEHFKSNQMLQDAVIRQFEIIGEATKNLSIKLKERAAHIPWKLIAGTRDVLIHQYFGVDLSSIWQYVVLDLPTLKKEVELLLQA